MDEELSNLHLSHEEDDELVLEDDSIPNDNTNIDLSLVGRFLTDQTVNFNLMRSRMASIWRPGKGVFIKDIGHGRFIFQFFHIVDLNRVLNGGPWSFNNIPLILHQLRQGEFPLKVKLDLVSFWVQVHGLPAGYISEAIGRQLGNFIGNFLEYDTSNTSSTWRQFMRLRVAIDVTQPLKRGKRIKKPDGSSFVANFKYERLHIFCFICGKLGHSESFCGQLFNNDGQEVRKEWGPWLKADDRRGQNLGGDRWLRHEEREEKSGENREFPTPESSRRGHNIFNFGKSTVQPENPPFSFNSGKKSSNNSGSNNGGNLQSEIRATKNIPNPMHNGNDIITPGDERKRRRSEEESSSGKKTEDNSATYLLEYHTENATTNSFLSAGFGSEARRTQ